MFVGESDPSLEEPDTTKLQAVMDVIRDVHASSCRVIERLTGRVPYPTFKEDFFDEVSRALEWVDLVKSSSCHKGVIRSLALCKPYYPYLDLDRLVQGFSELK